MHSSTEGMRLPLLTLDCRQFVIHRLDTSDSVTLAFIDKGLRRCTAGFVAAIDPVVPSIPHMLSQAQSATTHAPYVVCHRRVNSWRTLLRSMPPQACSEAVTTTRRRTDDRSSRVAINSKAPFHSMRHSACVTCTWWPKIRSSANR